MPHLTVLMLMKETLLAYYLSITGTAAESIDLRNILVRDTVRR